MAGWVTGYRPRTLSARLTRTACRLAALLGLFAGLAALLPAAALPASTLPALVDSFTGPQRAWKRTGPLVLQRRTDDPGSVLSLKLRPGGNGPGTFERRLPARRWILSLDVRVPPGGAATLRFAGGGPALSLTRRGGTGLLLQADAWRRTLPVRKGWRAGAWRHIEVVDGRRARFAIDGRSFKPPVRGGRSVVVTLRRGAVDLAALVATSASDRRALLLHRLAELKARTPADEFPSGTGSDGRLRFGRGWMSGFWPGALWKAAALTPRSDLFRGWANDVTIAHFGAEREDTHDLGFMYESSSVAAYERQCRGSSGAEIPDICGRLRSSALTAARSLLSLAETNSAAGMIPTRARSVCGGCAPLGEADTIIDSMMNLGLLLWAGRETGNSRFAEVATRHARNVARLLVRPDGSTFQSVHVRRSDGTVLLLHTHQGYSNTSTWARGQAWAVYGFASVARQLGSPSMLAVAERAAGYVAAKLPSGGIPPWDYDAPAGAQVDTSAGVITAAGLFELARACERLGGCGTRSDRWKALGRQILDASLGRARDTFPVGFLDDQVLNHGGKKTWDDRGEFAVGLYYALDAVRRAG